MIKTTQLGVMVHNPTLSTWEAEAQVWVQPVLHSVFKATYGNYLKTNKKSISGNPT